MANKTKKLSIANLKNNVQYNLGEGISLTKKDDAIFVGFPTYDNPNVSIVNVKRSDSSKKTFGSATVNVKNIGNMNIQIYRNVTETSKIDEKGNKVTNRDVAYSFRQNNNPIRKSEQLALFQLISNERDNIKDMLEKEVDVNTLEEFATKNLVGKENGSYKCGDIDVQMIDYKDSSSAYKSIIAQRDAGKSLSEAQQKVIDSIEDKANAGISRVVCKYKKRTLHAFDFDKELGTVTSDTENTATETINLEDEEEL